MRVTLCLHLDTGHGVMLTHMGFLLGVMQMF